MMEKYRRLIVQRIRLLALVVMLVVALGLYDVFWATEAMKASDVFGFQCGIAMGIGLLALAQILRYRSALQTENALKRQYNMENDERMRAIRAKAGMPMLLYTSLGMIVAAVFAGYTDSAAFYILVKAATCQLIIGCAVKMIDMKVM